MHERFGTTHRFGVVGWRCTWYLGIQCVGAVQCAPHKAPPLLTAQAPVRATILQYTHTLESTYSKRFLCAATFKLGGRAELDRERTPWTKTIHAGLYKPVRRRICLITRSCEETNNSKIGAAMGIVDGKSPRQGATSNRNEAKYNSSYRPVKQSSFSLHSSSSLPQELAEAVPGVPNRCYPSVSS